MSPRHDHDLTSDEMLVAFIDGELEPAESEALEALLREDAALSERLEFLASGKLAFDDALGPLLAEAPVARMAEAIKPYIEAPPSNGWFGRRSFIAAAAACLVAGVAIDRGIATWLGGGAPTAERGWRAAVANYMALYSVDTLQTIPADTASQAEEIRRVSQEVNLPLSLAAIEIEGKPFKRAQLLEFNEMPLAQLAYLDPVNGPLALCIFNNSTGPAGLKSEQRDGMNIVFWSTQDHSFMLIGRSSIAELTGEATQLQAAISA